MKFERSFLSTVITAVLSANAFIPTAIAADTDLVITESGVTVVAGHKVPDKGEPTDAAVKTGAAVTANVSNSGEIAGGAKDGIKIDHTLTGNISNDGNAIIGGASAIALGTGATISAGIVGSINNAEKAAIIGTTHGILIDAKGYMTHASATSPIITNNGNVETRATAETTADALTIKGATVGDIINGPTGTIQSSSGSGIHLAPALTPAVEGVTASTVKGNIDNSGTISGIAAGITLTTGTFDGQLINTGTITGMSTDGTTGKGVDISGTGSLGAQGISNVGTISGGEAGISVTSGKSVGVITNTATGQITGKTAAVVLSGEGKVADAPDGLDNKGLIEGADHGIFIDGEVKNYLQNSGTIRATASAAASRTTGGIALSINNIIGAAEATTPPETTDPETPEANPDPGTPEENTRTATTVPFGLNNQKGGVIESTGSGGTAISLGAAAGIKGLFSNAGTIRGETAITTLAAASEVARTTPPAFALENTGIIKGKITGGGIALTNNGTFCTPQGSVLASYAGAGKIIALLTNDIKTPVMTITGDATLETGSSVLVDGTGDFTLPGVAGREYVVVKAATPITPPEGLNVTASSALVGVSLMTTPTDPGTLSVLVKPRAAGTVISAIGATPEEQARLNAFYNEVIPHIAKHDPDDSAFAMFLATHHSPEGLLKLTRDLKPDTSQSSDGSLQRSLGATFSAISQRAAPPRSGNNFGDMFESGGAWAQILRSTGTQDESKESHGFKSRLNGVIVGFDSALERDWTAGLALAFTQGIIEPKNSNNSTETDSLIFSLYGGWDFDPWFADVILSYGNAKNKGERFNRTIKSDYDATLYGFNLTAGTEFDLSMAGLVLQPSAAFNYGKVSIDSYSEKGGSSALAVKAQNYNITELGVGIKGIKPLNMKDGMLDVFAGLNVWHDFSAKQAKVKSRFLLGDTVFTTTGDKLAKTYWQSSLGTEYQDDNMTVLLSYDHSLRKDFKTDSLIARFRYDF